MSEVITVQDLETLKKHEVFEAEVLTGKVGGLSTGVNIDYATNAATGQVQKTLPAILRDIGFAPASFDFTTGGTLATTDRDKAVLWPLSSGGDGDWYYWEGALPKVVPPASTPASTGGVAEGAWRPVGDVTLRADLASNEGVTLVGNAADKRGEEFTGAISAIGVKSTAHYGGVIVGDNPMGNPGDDWPSATGLRDAINVSRKILNEPTDCHAFADKTIIDTPNDAGTYGAVDVTTILRGAHVQNHIAAFQSRISYEGAGTLENLWGHIIWPTATSTGDILANVGVQIRGVETVTASIQSNRSIDIDPKGAIQENIGVIVRNGTCTNAPAVSFNSQQNSSGYSFYALALGALYNAGKTFCGDFGSNPLGLSGTFKLNAREATSTVTGSFSADSANGAFVAASGDSKISFIANGVVLGYWGKVADSKGFIANTDNTQPLGLASKRWSIVYAGTGAINTSDAREKTAPLPIDDAVLDAWGDVQLITFQWLESIRLKGDDARWHFGVIAQQVRDAFVAHGLHGCEYGLLCFDEWGEDEENSTPAGNRWGIRADQCLFLEAAYQRRRCDRIEARLASAGL